MKRKVVALFCAVFVLGLSEGYAQSNRVGFYVQPQGNFLGGIKVWKLDPSLKEKGLVIGEGIYYERCGNMSSFTIGLGAMQLKNTYTTDSLGTSYLRIGEGTNQLSFLTILLAGNTNFYDGDQFKVGMLYGFKFGFLLNEKINGFPKDFSTRDSYERLAAMFDLGVSFTYLFTDYIGMSVTPTASFFGRSTVEEPWLFWGFGGQVRFFYAFGN